MSENPKTRLLPSFAAPATDRVWLVAAHGGAGCTTIYQSGKDVWADAGRALPVCDDPSRPSRVLLCAMGTSRGLESLQTLLKEADAGLFAPTILVGAVVTMTSPRPPLTLERSRRHVCSIAPASWRLPFIRGLDVDGFPSRWPAAYARLAAQASAGPGTKRHES